MHVTDTIRFITANNVVVERTIVGKARHPDYQPYYPDLTIYTLDSPLPGTITPCKILPANYATYLSDVERHRPPVIVMDQQEKARVFDLFALANGVGGTKPTLAPDREAFYELGLGQEDSGNPVFLIVNDALVLLTTQSNIGTGTFVTPHLSALNAMIAAADAHATSRGFPVNSGLQVQTIDLSGFSPFTPP